MNRPWVTSILMFVWLSVGYTVVHVAVDMWAISVGSAIWPDPVPTESLQITDDGEALIQSAAGGRRRLDGTPVQKVMELNPSLKPAHPAYY